MARPGGREHRPARSGPVRVPLVDPLVTRLRRPGGSRFQGSDEPYPRHWRVPAPWPAGFTDGPAIRERLERAVRRSLPPLWRAVLLARDGDRRPAEQVAAELGISLAQQRCILNRARAAVRDELAGRREL